MAAFDTTRPVAALSGGAVSRFFTTLFADLVAWNEARQTRNALFKLTDRELDDIGLSRADISNIDALIR